MSSWTSACRPATTAASWTRWRRTSRAALAPDRDAEAYKLAAAMLTGEDAFGMAFIEAFRAGRLGEAAAG